MACRLYLSRSQRLKGCASPDHAIMKQQDRGLNLNKRRTRKAEFFKET